MQPNKSDDDDDDDGTKASAILPIRMQASTAAWKLPIIRAREIIPSASLLFVMNWSGGWGSNTLGVSNFWSALQ